MVHNGSIIRDRGFAISLHDEKAFDQKTLVKSYIDSLANFGKIKPKLLASYLDSLDLGDIKEK